MSPPGSGLGWPTHKHQDVQSCLQKVFAELSRALHAVFPTIKEPLEEGYYYPHGTGGETKTQSLLRLTKMVST